MYKCLHRLQLIKAPCVVKSSVFCPGLFRGEETSLGNMRRVSMLASIHQCVSGPWYNAGHRVDAEYIMSFV